MGNLKNILKGKKHLHFIGIGGSGMFPIAQILHTKGYYITGSDNNPSDTLELVKKMGIPVTMGQSAENIEGADLIIHTAAIMEDNPELMAARSSGVDVIERSVMLGLITEWYTNAICISGTHGKTTACSMLTQILYDAGMDPSAVIGGKLPEIGGNGRAGESDLMVCEACEFVDTFLQLAPDTAVVLNIDRDHLDYFKTMENLIASFNKFAKMATKEVIVNGDDPNSMKAMEGVTAKITTFGFGKENDYYADDIKIADGLHSSFAVYKGGKKLDDFDIFVPGKHNVLNALAAIVAALHAGATLEQTKIGLASFHGAGRRFELLARVNGVTIADDYAHHPAEIAATLKAAKEMSFKRVIAVHQPFTYSRTKMLLGEFADALQIADIVILSEIMGSREKNTCGIYSKDLAEKIPGCTWFPDFEALAENTAKIAQEGDLIITLGCGDIYKAAKIIIKLLKEKKS